MSRGILYFFERLHRFFVEICGELSLKLQVDQRGFPSADQVGDAGGESVNDDYITHHGQRGQKAGADPSEPIAAEDHNDAQADPGGESR